MADLISRLETFLVRVPSSEPYIPSGEATDALQARGYDISPVNRTLYPVEMKSVLVRVTTSQGLTGWGETYGLCAPLAVKALHEDIVEPFIVGRDPQDVQLIWEDLYDLMRVRGYTGFYLDALAAVDIALWDILGKRLDVPISVLTGGRRRNEIPSYVSGLEGDTLSARVSNAGQWVADGATGFKLAATRCDDLEAELSALREALGPAVALMVDLHWQHSAGDAARRIKQLERHDLTFAEAPCKPEDITGLQSLSRRVSVPIAAGEEWRTVYDAMPRLSSGAVSVVQPEMGHTGITQFMRIAQAAQAHHAYVAPHATIGTGIFLAASLHASCSIRNLTMHEYHPRIFDDAKTYLNVPLVHENGAYRVPVSPGLGVEPSEQLLSYVAQQ